MYSGYVGIGTSTSLSLSTSELSTRSMASDVPAVMSTRSADTGKPLPVSSDATASRAGAMPGEGP